MKNSITIKIDQAMGVAVYTDNRGHLYLTLPSLQSVRGLKYEAEAAERDYVAAFGEDVL